MCDNPDCKCENCTCSPCTCAGTDCGCQMKIKELLEYSEAGGTNASSIAVVANPTVKTKKGKYGAPKAPQATKADGTAKNALDMKANVMGGKAIKR